MIFLRSLQSSLLLTAVLFSIGVTAQEETMRAFQNQIARTYCSSTVNNQKDIIVENMPSLARQIAAHVPVIVAEKETE